MSQPSGSMRPSIHNSPKAIAGLSTSRRVAAASAMRNAASGPGADVQRGLLPGRAPADREDHRPPGDEPSPGDQLQRVQPGLQTVDAPRDARDARAHGHGGAQRRGADEEQGLLGSQYFAMHPPVPVGRIAANINIDEANWFGKTRDISLASGVASLISYSQRRCEAAST